ncbi:unnamed protein product, partial [Mesorhabditis belari]|uniref:C3H1-type domain-containing protein n=1 Tax=Mesorhabditis belari TaxID=2138241 RepID=A0AAF3FDV9_9BILA
MGDYFLQEEAEDDGDFDDDEDDLPLAQVRKNVVEEHHRQQQQLEQQNRVLTKAEVVANTREMEKLLAECDNFNPGIQTENLLNQLNHQANQHAHIPDQGAIILPQNDFLETPRLPMDQSMPFGSPQNNPEQLQEPNSSQDFTPNQQMVQQTMQNDPYQPLPDTSTQEYYPNYAQNNSSQQIYNNPMLGDQSMYQIDNNQSHYQQNMQQGYNPMIEQGYQGQMNNTQMNQMMYEAPPQNEYPSTSMAQPAQQVEANPMQQVAYQEQYQVQQPAIGYPVQQQPPMQQTLQQPLQQQFPETQQIQYRRLPENAQVVHQSNAAHEFLRTPDGRLIRVVRQQAAQRQIVQRLMYNPQTNSYQQVQMVEYPQDPYNQSGRVIRVVQPQQQAQPQMLPASMSQQQQLYQQRQQSQAASSSAPSQTLFPVATTPAHYNNGAQTARSLSFNPPNIRYINPDGTPAEPPMSAYKPELKPHDTEGMPTLDSPAKAQSSPIKVIRQPPPRPRPGVPQLMDKKPTVKAPFAHYPDGQQPPSQLEPSRARVEAGRQNGNDSREHGYASSSTHQAPYAPPKFKPRPPMDAQAAQLKKTMKAAKESAIKRLSTESGWKMMNGWLKKAKGDDKKTLSLLKELIKADVPVELLMDTNVDTPRFLVSLKKKGGNQMIRDIAADLVARYKEDVQKYQKEGPKKKEETKELKKEEEIPDEGSPEMGEELPEFPKAVEIKSPKTLEREAKKKEKRSKARVYQSKGRTTGLEGNPEDDLPPPAPVEAPKPDYRPLHDERKLKKITVQRDSKEKEKVVAKEKPKPVETKKEEKPKTPEKPAVEKKVVVKSPILPTLSNSFMDAFGPAKAEPVKKKPKRPTTKDEKDGELAKKSRSDSTDEPLSPLERPQGLPSVDINLGGLFSDVTTERKEPEIQISGAATPTEKSNIKSNDPSTSASATPFQGWVSAKKRISFADDVGKDLVHIREFEVDENERYNVSHLTPEEIIKRDLELEKIYKQEHKTEEEEEDREKIPSPSDISGENDSLHPLDPRRELIKGKPERKWRLVLVEDHGLTTKEKNLFQSQEFFVEQDRQSRTLSVIFDGKLGTIDRDEPKEKPDPDHTPVSIPLFSFDDEVPDIEPTSSTHAIPSTPMIPSEPDPQKSLELPSNLKNLLSGLKSAGIISLPSAQHQYQQVDQTGAPVPVTAAPFPQASQDYPSYPHHGGPPMRGGFGGRGRGWPNSRIACQYINTPKGCTYGDRCRFSHDPKDLERMKQGGYGRGQPFDRGHPPNRPYRGGFHPRT